MNRKHDLNLTGKRFGRLVAIRPLPKQPNRPYRWRCQCDCGKLISVRGDCLRYGFTKSCGCLRVDNGVERGHASLKHGDSHAPEYRAWANMKDRCHNPDSASFKHYGARGITVCESWLKYENFLVDMGRKPSADHSLGRIDNDKGYSPSNCRWETQEEQANNKRDFDRGAHLRGKKHSKARRAKTSKAVKKIWRLRRLGKLPYPRNMPY